MIEIQCTSCHTRYRIDEKVLPEGLPTFKCSRCGHVFTHEPRTSRAGGQTENSASQSPVFAQSTSDPLHKDSLSEDHQPLPGVADRPTSKGPAPDSGNSEKSGVADSPHGDAVAPRQDFGANDHEEPFREPEAGQESYPPARDETDSVETAAALRPPPSPPVKAKQGGKFSQLSTGSDSDTSSGENLSFDFTDEEPAPDLARLTRRNRRSASTEQPSHADSERWEVGETPSESIAAQLSNRDSFGEEEIPGSRPQMRIDDIEPQFADESAFVDEEEAPVYNRALTRSARFVVLLIFLVGAGFAALTMLIRSAPDQWAAVLSYLPVVGDRFVVPATPAKLVALRNVNAFYQHGKEGQHTLVISGVAENVGTASLRIVQLTAALRDTQRRALASQAVYCGNTVSAGMIGQMTPHEIEFFQKLEPAKTFELEPSASCRFVAVFLNPPGTARAYDVGVSQAVPGTAQTMDEPGS
jgi:predicted Zn finger-like uncharacterized protein